MCEHNGRRCIQFYCDHRGERVCCADCNRKHKCKNPCLNDPSRCGLLDARMNIKKKNKENEHG